ncbi:MAG: NAD(P)H-binding protein [Spirochaetota bacterium]
MRILLLGATGGSGRAFIDAALKAGHEVGALVRGAGRLPVQPGLVEFSGDVTKPETVEAAIAAFKPEAAVSTLGTRGVEAGSLTEVMGPVVALFEKHGIRRFLYLSSVGVGDSMGQLGFLARAIIVPLFLKAALKEKEPQERAIMASSLEWTIARPGSLVDAPILGAWKCVENVHENLGRPVVSRADLASFLVGELAERKYLRKAVSLTSP